MSTALNFYDEDFLYDGDAFYDGQEAPVFVAGGSVTTITSEKRKPKKKEYCRVEIDYENCNVNEEPVFCNFKRVNFECEEDEDDIPNFGINSIKIIDNQISDNLYFEVPDYIIKSTKTKNVSNEFDICIDNIEIEDSSNKETAIVFENIIENNEESYILADDVKIVLPEITAKAVAKKGSS